ncbi:MAG: pyridoxal-dependent decarboxylase [Planctomycetota bacterium]|nr:pyridoxal-dependent decarboxylase [Planctomycetota bacterium]
MKAPVFRKHLTEIRNAFPQPVSDPQHDSYFVFSILRALDRVDSMKSEVPILGKLQPLNYSTAEDAHVADEMSTLEIVSRNLVDELHGMPIWGHPRTQINVVPPTTIPSIIGSLLPAIYNPNLVSDDTAHAFELAEAKVVAMTAELIGYDRKLATGVFTFGGTGTTLYGVKIGIEKALPDAMVNGVGSNAVLISSKQSHYCRLNVAGWLGIGEKNVIAVPTSLRNEMHLESLESAAKQAIESGKRIVAIIATMGTTDAFGIDDLGAIVALRDQLVEDYDLDYVPHVHADAVIGWAWSVFRDYDFEENDLGFRPRTVRALAGATNYISKLHLADSVGIDFHKTGFAPYISSLFLVKDAADVNRLVRGREQMPYLFQTGERHPGVFTLETSRGAGGVLSAMANLQLFGKVGLRSLLGHLVEMAELLREHLDGHTNTTVLNHENFGTVTLFRVYPDGVDTWKIKDRERTDESAKDELLAHNEYNRRIFHHLHDQALQGKGVRISMTDCYRHTEYGEPIVALKSYMLSPFIEEEHVELLVSSVLKAREAISHDD